MYVLMLQVATHLPSTNERYPYLKQPINHHTTSSPSASTPQRTSPATSQLVKYSSRAAKHHVSKVNQTVPSQYEPDAHVIRTDHLDGTSADYLSGHTPVLSSQNSTASEKNTSQQQQQQPQAAILLGFNKSDSTDSCADKQQVYYMMYNSVMYGNN